MNRLKKLWDLIYPELKHFTSENLRDQANQIVKRKDTMKTTCSIKKNSSRIYRKQ